MTFPAFLAEVQKLKLEEQRVQTSEYLEVVVSRDSLASLHTLLTAYFGLPLKPEGNLPSGDANQRAKPYGGIRKNQTMYFHQAGDFCEYAFLWPWEGGAQVTVKIIQSRDERPSQGGFKNFLNDLFVRKS